MSTKMINMVAVCCRFCWHCSGD